MRAGVLRESLLKNSDNPLGSKPIDDDCISGQSRMSTQVNPTPNHSAVDLSEKSASVLKLPIFTIGTPKESYDGEKRVAQSPESVALLVKKGFRVCIERGAGIEASYPDSVYMEAGAHIVTHEEAFSCDAVLKVRAPEDDELALCKQGGILYCFIYPAQNPVLIQKLASKEMTVFALDCVPRITRAQTFDALSSMANIAGYKAVVEAAHHFGRFLSGQMTAAGRIPPAKVLVIGGGVAGLAAVVTAKNMGAIVRCFDTRPAVRSQVESLGGEFLEVTGVQLEEGTGGYAKEMSPEFIAAEMRMFAEQAREVDILITTALIPGKPAPKLISAQMVNSMKCGSVIVDLAAEMGGNVETTHKGEIYVSENGVTHIGVTDLPSRLSNTSSKLYSNNISKLFVSMIDPGTAELLVDIADDVTASMIILRQGSLMWPPARTIAPPKVASAPIVSKAAVKAGPTPFQASLNSAILLSVLLLSLVGLSLLTTDRALLFMVSTFCLAGTAGYLAVWGVAPALHTPLMSVTNAVSGITVVGGLLLIGDDNVYTRGLAALAIFASCVNIAGGFLVTKRMLGMFKRKGDPKDHAFLYCIPVACLLSLYFFGKHFIGFAGVDMMSYLACSMCCIGGIGGLASQKTARFGNILGMVGVFCGVMITLGVVNLPVWYLLIALVVMASGSAIGLLVGRVVQITELPQTVAAFHSFVGLAAMVTSVAHFLSSTVPDSSVPIVNGATNAAAFFGDVIGGVTLTGSLVAFAKLQGIMSSKALNLRGKNWLNIGSGLVLTFLFACFMNPELYYVTQMGQVSILVATGVLSMILGYHLVASVGGGDMPVCITVLNSYSGWALVAEGFMFNNVMLTIVGSLIGFSGGILSFIMCVAMNRSLANVLFGGYATVAPSKQSKNKEIREHRETTPEETVDLIASAKSIVIVPGYGMAVARSQYVIAELTRVCRAHNINVVFAIHPVAGRMPGQMNVLLAEAGVPYDWVKEMDEVNDDFGSVDLCLVVGANDITNSLAEEDPTCAIGGMPVLQVWKSTNCVFMKRSMAAGYADMDNPVFYKPNTLMLLGDAKATLEKLVARLKAQYEP